MTQSLVVVYTTAGQVEANIIKGLLEAAGIPAVISQEGAGAAFGFTVGAMGMVDILVAEKDAAEAEAIIAAMERGELAQDIPNPSDQIPSETEEASDTH